MARKLLYITLSCLLLVPLLTVSCQTKTPETTPSTLATPPPTTETTSAAPKPASFVVSNLNVSPSEVISGSPVIIEVMVTNNGELSGTYTVTLKIDDTTEGTEQVTLDSGASRKVTFTKTKYIAKTYSVAIDGQSGQFTVSSWREVSAPSNISVPGAQWIEVDAPEGKKILASVFYPQGTGPFPVVVWLHGTGGFQLSDVEMARDFAKAGFIGVAAGWFGGHYTGIEVVTPIASWPEAIDWPNGPDINSRGMYVNNILALLGAVCTLPRVRADSLGLIGHSRGSTVSIKTAATDADIKAVVALAGYPQNTPLNSLRAPVLILQGTADDCISVDQARAFEETLRALGKSFESHYYEGATHMFPQTPPWRDDMLQRAITLFNKYLVP